MIRYAEVRQAAAWIDRSGVPTELEALLRPTNRGRPRQLTVRALLVGVKLAIDHSKTSCLSEVHALLTHDLNRNDQLELGVRDRHTGHAITLPQVRRLFTRIAEVLDPAQPRHEPQPAAPLQHVLDRLLDATMPDTPHQSGAYAIDGTGVWSWARGKRRTDQAADPDARWGVKTSKTGKTEAYFGYELHALVRIGTTGQQPSTTPCMAERVIVVPAATNCVTAVLPTLSALRSQGRPVREIVADRGYTYKLNWTSSLHALGIDPVLDLHATQYGPQGSHHGARIITGVPHCPAMPTAFDTLKRPERLSDSTRLDDFITDVQRREQWAFRRVAGPDESGKERYECPARSGKVRCPLHKPSLQQPLALPKVTHPPTEPSRCCTQRTITVPGDIDAKSRQRHYWGTPTWIAAFRRRSRVEGWFGNIKSHSTEGLRRGTFRVTGLTKTTLMLGIYSAATNLRLLRRWQPQPEPARNRLRAASRDKSLHLDLPADTHHDPPTLR